MKNSGKLAMAVLMTVFTLPALADRNHNPPGPAGGPGTNWNNPPGPAGGPGVGPGGHHRHHKHHRLLQKHMTNAEWLAFRSLTLAERHAFCDKKRIRRDDCWYDKDDNPPGPAGGAGTNWENPPGPAGGPGASPDRR